ncbi:hypothetical protein PGQ11_007743 [Apiospora arundinis]|uniref:HIT domain-containing protein n=1 Tax=Apiospora arundinis TaxID=335852 RepID=A0ABR2IWD9_9PEZI
MGDEGYRLALEHYEELKSNIHQIDVKDFKFGLHLFPHESVSHLHMHVIAATKSIRKYSTSRHDQKTKDALEVRDVVVNVAQVPTHGTASTVTEAIGCQNRNYTGEATFAQLASEITSHGPQGRRNWCSPSVPTWKSNYLPCAVSIAVIQFHIDPQ